MADINLTHTGAQLDDAIAKVLADYADVSGVTAVAADVLAPKIFVDASGVEREGTNTGGGTDTSDATGGTADLLYPKTMYGATGKVAGTMPDKSGTAQDSVAEIDSTYIAIPIPANGYYNTIAKIRDSFTHLASLIGLTAAKILAGNTILGIAGTAITQDNTLLFSIISRTAIKIAIPTGATEIGINAFGYCESLTMIWIPSTVTTINTDYSGDSPFFGCSEACQIYCEAGSKPAGFGPYWARYSSSYSLDVTYSTTLAAFNAL